MKVVSSLQLQGEKVINGKNCTDKQRLFNEFADELSFPSYFGRNWDSFEELLNEYSSQLLISNADSVLFEADNEELEIFVDILKSSQLEVTFQCDTPEPLKERLLKAGAQID